MKTNICDVFACGIFVEFLGESYKNCRDLILQGKVVANQILENFSYTFKKQIETLSFEGFEMNFFICGNQKKTTQTKVVKLLIVKKIF